MTVKIEDIRVGDEVLVRCVVTDVSPKDVYSICVRASVCVQAQPSWVAPMDIAQHVPRKIKVGDDVVVNSGGLSGARGTIRAIYGQFAWVFSNSVGGYCTVPLSDLERVS